MQAKIDAFFKPSTARNPIPSPSGGAAPVGDVVELPVKAGSPDLDIVVTYKRRRDPQLHEGSCYGETKEIDSQASEVETGISVSYAKRSSEGKVLNKKRSYAQYHLELGQSDFLLHTCSICGMSYACGDEGDEKVHKTFHNNYYQGIPFKGWRNERVIFMNKDIGDRIILVLDGDPPAHKQKILQVVNLLESELGLSDGWLFHELCKVYLFISSNRIVGCAFAEPIKWAYRVISNSVSSSNGDHRKTTKSTPQGSSPTDEKLTGSDHTVLQFGNITFRREAIKRIPSSRGPYVNLCHGGAIICEEEPVPALCGIRAIWVVPSKRRQHIATKLLDSVRKNFGPNTLIEASKCAFSQPTSAGKALASSYSRTESFLVYKAENN